MHKNRSHVLALSLAVVLLFVGSQFGWPIWVEKEACFQDIALSICIDSENGEPELFFAVGLSPDENKTHSFGPVLLPEESLQGPIHPCSLYEGLISRPPPMPLST